MNYLLAKLKGKNGAVLKVVSLRTDIIDSPELSHSKLYSSSYKLEDEEWYYLENFSKSDYSNDLIIESLNSTQYNQITKKQFEKIKYFWIKQDDDFYFQKINTNQVVKNKWFIISDEPKLEKNEKIIILNNWADAVYVPDEDKLYFREVSKIKTFFSGIGEIYREATNPEVGDFLNEDFLTVADDFAAENVKIPNRKRIAMAIDTLNNFDDDDRKYIFKYIKEYCSDIAVKDETFCINDEGELTQVLWGIEQRYYTTPLGHEKRLANSVTKIG